MWAIVDKVQLPNISGDFVLRWRWVRGRAGLLARAAFVWLGLWCSDPSGTSDKTNKSETFSAGSPMLVSTSSRTLLSPI
jgi:hypothetical protein